MRRHECSSTLDYGNENAPESDKPDIESPACRADDREEGDPRPARQVLEPAQPDAPRLAVEVCPT
jgi:hypothetical protein